MGTLAYLKNFFTDKNVASVTPSSESTVKRVCQYIDFNKDITLVEYGPGDGVFTKYLLANMTGGSRLIAIETNEGFVGSLHKIEDERLRVVHGSAEDVKHILSEDQITTADAVISGIPFSFLSVSLKRKIVLNTSEILQKNGVFLVYQTSKHMVPYLKETFANVHHELELVNIPPMTIMRASNSKD